jgi:hypothetical protein
MPIASKIMILEIGGVAKATDSLSYALSTASYDYLYFIRTSLTLRMDLYYNYRSMKSDKYTYKHVTYCSYLFEYVFRER